LLGCHIDTTIRILFLKKICFEIVESGGWMTPLDVLEWK
jgi:hypothetical protein